MTRRVRCYPLLPLLTAEQAAAVRPFLRETFTETWTACCDALGEPGFEARMAPRDAARVPEQLQVWTLNGDEGRRLERHLYARAVREGHRPVMAAGRRR